MASEETLRNVIRSVTRNWRSIIMTGLLAVILVYLFSIIGYLYFQKGTILLIMSNDFDEAATRNVFVVDAYVYCVFRFSIGS